MGVYIHIGIRICICTQIHLGKDTAGGAKTLLRKSMINNLREPREVIRSMKK